MPLDSNIPLSVQPFRLNNPFDVLAKMRAEKAQDEERREALRQRDAALRQSQQRLDREAAQDAEATRQQFSKQQIHDAADSAYRKIKDGNAEEVLSLLPPESRMLAESWLSETLKAKQARDAAGIAEGKRTAQFIQANNYDPVTSATALKVLADVHPGAKDALEHVTDPAAFKKLIDHFATIGDKPAPLIEHDPQKEQRSATGELITAAQPAEAKTPATFQAAILAAKDPMEKNRLIREAREYEAATRAPAGPQDVGPLETIIGPNGTPIRVPRAQAVGKAPASGTEKPSSGQQKRVLSFFNRARQADEELEGLEAQIQKLSTAGQAQMDYAPNFMQSQLGQSYGAAQRAFTEARLRKDSGAAIPEQEFANDKRTYFAKTGDSAETLEQKRRARAAILASLAFESGQALGEDLGDPDEAKAVIQRYKDRSSKTAPKANGIKILKIEQVP